MPCSSYFSFLSLFKLKRILCKYTFDFKLDSYKSLTLIYCQSIKMIQGIIKQHRAQIYKSTLPQDEPKITRHIIPKMPITASMMSFHWILTDERFKISHRNMDIQRKPQWCQKSANHFCDCAHNSMNPKPLYNKQRRQTSISY